MSDAADAVRKGNATAQGTMTAGVNTANNLISNNADQAIGYVNDAANAGQGYVNDAVTGAQTGIKSAVTGAQSGMQPYIAAGTDATGRLSDLAGQQFKFTQDDPSYQFRLQQGAQALQRSAAARGGLLGGGTAKALSQFGQNLASTEYQAAFNRFDTNRNSTARMLSDLSGKGLNASQYSGDVGMKGAEYSGDIGMRGATLNSGIGMDAARYGGDAKMRSAEGQGRNTMFGSEYNANMDANTGQVTGQEHIGRSNAWNGMLSGIGQGLDSALAGGFGGGGGFSLTGALSGVPQYGGGGRGGGGGGFQVPTSSTYSPWTDPYGGQQIPGVSDYQMPPRYQQSAYVR